MRSLRIKWLAPLLIRVGGAMKQSDPEAELGKSHNISAAPLHPRRAALGQRDTKVGSDSSSSCGDTGGGREAAGQGMGIDNWSHIIFCPADCLPIVVQLLVTLYLMRLRRLFALTNAFSLTMKNSRPIFVFLDA